jgi:TnpA family transposase
MMLHTWPQPSLRAALTTKISKLSYCYFMPATANIHSLAKTVSPETGKADAYANLQLILSKAIDWDLVRQQYDQMIKYTTALRLGTAETEAILRRFTKKNLQHPISVGIWIRKRCVERSTKV